MLASSPEVSCPDQPGPELPSPIVPQPGAQLVLCRPPGASPSAALDVLLDDDAAVSEEWAGQRLQQSPRVGAGVEGLHVAEGRTLAAHDAPRGVDLPVQDNGTAEKVGSH